MNGMWVEISTMRRCARFGRDSYEGPWQIATSKLHNTVFMVMVMVVVAAGTGSLNLKGHGGWWREGDDEGPYDITNSYI